MNLSRRYNRVLTKRFHRKLDAGRHDQDGMACALEVLSVVQGIPWTDNPVTLHIWDIRSLNDASWSNKRMRATALAPFVCALAGSLDWPFARQQATATTIVLETVRVLLSALPGLPEALRTQCAHVSTLEAAEAAVAPPREREKTGTEILLQATALWLAAIATHS